MNSGSDPDMDPDMDRLAVGQGLVIAFHVAEAAVTIDLGRGGGRWRLFRAARALALVCSLHVAVAVGHGSGDVVDALLHQCAAARQLNCSYGKQCASHLASSPHLVLWPRREAGAGGKICLPALYHRNDCK